MNSNKNKSFTAQEKTKSELALRSSEARYKAAITAVAGIVWTNDFSGRMKGEQPGWSQLTGQTVDEYADYGWANAVHPDDALPTIEAWNAAVAEKRLFVFEHRVKTVQGEWRLFSIRAVPVLGPDGEIEEWVGVHTDITEERRQKEELRRLAAELSHLSQRKSEFLAVLAHELRNPLAPIRTGLDLMGISSENPAVLNRARKMMERQVNHMVHLIDDLLDIARITSGKVELQQKTVRLDEITSIAIEASTPIFQASSHSFSTFLPDEAVYINADPVRISQVLINLLTNAAKYTPHGGAVTLAAQCDGQNVIISVTDSGMGIPKEAIGSVFDMFSQVSRNLGRAQGGLGIGLAIVKQLVELHGGSVGVSSDGENTGSTFTVTLPVVSATDCTGTPTLAVQSGHGLPVRPLKILVADDNRDAANSLATLLQLQNHEVILANDGSTALAKACEKLPEIMFLDIGMPGLTGLEVARAIRSDRAYDHITLIALTGWGTEADRQRSREAGFNFHLTKPIHLAVVNKLLQSIGAGLGSDAEQRMAPGDR